MKDEYGQVIIINEKLEKVGSIYTKHMMSSLMDEAKFRKDLRYMLSRTGRAEINEMISLMRLASGNNCWFAIYRGKDIFLQEASLSLSLRGELCKKYNLILGGD